MYLTIAIGCTGGRHRSVFVAEQLAVRLRQEGQRVELAHRDIGPPAASQRGVAESPVPAVS